MFLPDVVLLWKLTGCGCSCENLVLAIKTGATDGLSACIEMFAISDYDLCLVWILAHESVAHFDVGNKMGGDALFLVLLKANLAVGN